MARATARLSALWVTMAAVAVVALSCGSEDAKKSAPGKDYEPSAGAGGAESPSSGGGKSDAGDSEVGGEGQGGKAPEAGGAGNAAGTRAEAGAGGGAATDDCPLGYANCDASDPDCETRVDTTVACGSCDTSCDAVHGQPVCEDLECVVPPGACEALYGDCDHDGRNGCETPLVDDAANCGACDRTCEAGTPCENGHCATLKVVEEPATSDTTWDFRFIGDKVFFLRTDGVHYATRNPETLPTTSTLVASSASSSLTNDDTFLYWMRETQPVTIRKLPIDLSSGVAIVNDKASGYLDPYYNLPKLVLTPTGFVFPVGYYDPNARSIMALGKGPTATPTPIITGRGVIRYLSLFGGHLVWQEDGGSGSQIFTAPLQGSNEDVKLVDTCSYNCAFRSDGRYLYYVQAVALLGKVVRFDLDDPEAEPESLLFDQTLGNGILVDERYIYYIDTSAGQRLMRLLKDDSADPEVVTVLPSNGNAFGLVQVDDTYVWLQQFEDLLRTPK